MEKSSISCDPLVAAIFETVGTIPANPMDRIHAVREAARIVEGYTAYLQAGLKPESIQALSGIFGETLRAPTKLDAYKSTHNQILAGTLSLLTEKPSTATTEPVTDEAYLDSAKE